MPNIQEDHFWLHAKEMLRSRLSLTDEKADDAVIDERIRCDIEMKGGNLWVLMFAIFVASVGLNVNSTAVVIGAMLISPLMGPIIGIGYGAGINDFALLRKSFKNLAIATFIGLFASTLYFAISPLDTAQSELLSRTTPTAWDVLIGLFGGLAGIVAVTRKEKTNVIPGVAIATALMPPLCTAGFGLATGHWSYFFGAFYLYVINFVFIAVSSFLVIRIFHVSEKKYIDIAVAKRAQRYIVIIVLATILPSSYLAYQLVNEEIFKAKANAFVSENLNFKNTNVAQVKIDPKSNNIKVFLIGEHIPQKKLDDIKVRLFKIGLKTATLKVYQNGEHESVDITSLKANIIGDFYKNSTLLLDEKNKEIEVLQAKLNTTIANNELFEAVPRELQAIFPTLSDIVLSQVTVKNSEDLNKTKNILILNAKSVKKMSNKEKQRIEQWLQMRTKNTQARLIIR